MPAKKAIPKSHVSTGYRDIFGVRDARKGPLVLADCTSIEWLTGWTAEHGMATSEGPPAAMTEKVTAPDPFLCR